MGRPTLQSVRTFSTTLAAVLMASSAHAAVVFSTDFESGLAAELSSPGAAIEGVQGWAGLGAPGNQFSGSFLRYADTAVQDTQLTLTGLPAHDTLSLGFLLAVIDSWDGTELLEVTVDGVLLFSNSFSLATDDVSSYVPPAGGLLSSGTDLGFSGGGYYNRDRAYDLSLEPAFTNIPHTASSVTIVWRLNATPGGGASFWQGGLDESWAIDNLAVSVADSTATSTSTSTSTTSTMQTSPTTTTTTVPQEACAGVPDGPTFSSLICRLAAELARVNAEPTLGSFQPKLSKTLTKGHDRATEARDLCAASGAKKAKARLKQVERAVIQYAHRLKGLAARRKLDAALRTSLLAPTGALRTDAKTLRSGARCPEDAS